MKKIFLNTAVMLISAVMAAFTVTVPINAAEAISVANGTEFEIRISVSEREPVGSVDAEITYESEYLMFCGIKASLDGCGVNSTDSKIILSCWNNTVTTPANEFEATLTFKAKKVGKTSVNADITDIGSFVTEKSLGSKQISIKTDICSTGDVNFDGYITSLDREILSGILSGKRAADGFKCDFDGDGSITPRDRTLLSRYLGGWGEEYDIYFISERDL